MTTTTMKTTAAFNNIFNFRTIYKTVLLCVCVFLPDAAHIYQKKHTTTISYIEYTRSQHNIYKFTINISLLFYFANGIRLHAHTKKKYSSLPIKEFLFTCTSFFAARLNSLLLHFYYKSLCVCVCVWAFVSSPFLLIIIIIVDE